MINLRPTLFAVLILSLFMVQDQSGEMSCSDKTQPTFTLEVNVYIDNKYESTFIMVPDAFAKKLDLRHRRTFNERIVKIINMGHFRNIAAETLLLYHEPPSYVRRWSIYSSIASHSSKIIT